MADPPGGHSSNRLLRRENVSGVLVTLAACAGVALLSRFVFPGNLPLLGVIYAVVVAAIVYSALTRGLAAGLLSAGIGGAYAYVHYLALEGIFPALADRLLLATGVAIFDISLALLVGTLVARTEALTQRAIEAEQAHSAVVEAKAAELSRANAALGEANEALEAFTYVVSHDLKEPVRALNHFSRALEEDHGPALPAEARDLVRRNVETSERLARLLQGLLEFSRAGRISARELEPVRVEDVMGSVDCVARYEHLLAERHARVVVTPGPAVMATAPALSQILGNLALNALRHNPNPKPVVAVGSATWREDPAYVEILVQDNGPGFTPAVMERFERLKQGRPSTVRGGFGLLIAKRAVERLGGKMWLGKSDEYGGAAVHFVVPAAEGSLRSLDAQVEGARASRLQK